MAKARIANNVAQMSMEKARFLGYNGALARATTAPSQAYCRKMGFEVLKVIKHDDFCDENGKRLISSIDGTNQG